MRGLTTHCTLNAVRSNSTVSELGEDVSATVSDLVKCLTVFCMLTANIGLVRLFAICPI